MGGRFLQRQRPVSTDGPEGRSATSICPGRLPAALWPSSNRRGATPPHTTRPGTDCVSPSPSGGLCGNINTVCMSGYGSPTPSMSGRSAPRRATPSSLPHYQTCSRSRTATPPGDDRPGYYNGSRSTTRIQPLFPTATPTRPCQRDSDQGQGAPSTCATPPCHTRATPI